MINYLFNVHTCLQKKKLLLSHRAYAVDYYLLVIAYFYSPLGHIYFPNSTSSMPSPQLWAWSDDLLWPVECK